MQTLKVSHYKTTPLEMDGNIGLPNISVLKALVNFRGADSVLCDLFYQDVTTTSFCNT